MSFAASDSTYTWQGGDTEKEKMTIARRCVCVLRGGGDYSREAIGLNISV